MALNLGGVIRLTCAVKNDLGVLTNPSSATLAITQPDGVVATPTVTLPPATTGQLVVDFAPTQAGLHSVHWATTGPITAEDDMFVGTPGASLLISVDEAVSHLNAAGILTTDAHREKLQDLCLVATDMVERKLGRKMVRHSEIETYNGGVDGFILRSSPIISITSVVENGTTLAGTDYLLDSHTGILKRGNTTSRLYWAYGEQNVVVTYVVGYANPPQVARYIALVNVQELWQSSQQAAHPLLDEATGFPVSPTVVVPDYLRDAFMSLKAHGVA